MAGSGRRPLMGGLHAVICNLPRVNYVAVGIALMIFGMGLSWFLGNRYIGDKATPAARTSPSVSGRPARPVQDALRINVLFLLGAALAPVLAWMLANTRWGLILRLAGESEEAAAAMGYSVNRIRIVATAIGGFLAGIGGSYLSLYLSGSWNEQHFVRAGLMAVALVIFARWKPMNCLWASLLFGGVGSVGRVLQSAAGPTSAQATCGTRRPYILTLVIMIITSSRARAMIGAPLELSRVRDCDTDAVIIVRLATLRRSVAAAMTLLRSALRSTITGSDEKEWKRCPSTTSRRTRTRGRTTAICGQQHGPDRHRHADRLLRQGRLRRCDGLRPVADARPDQAYRRAS